MFVYLASGFRLNFESKISWTQDSLDWISHVPGEVLDLWVKYLDSGYQNYEIQNWVLDVKGIQRLAQHNTDTHMRMLYHHRVESRTLELLFGDQRGYIAEKVKQALKHLQDMMYRHYFDVSTDASVGAISDTDP